MKFRFEAQTFQGDAVNAVVGLFDDAVKTPVAIGQAAGASGHRDFDVRLDQIALNLTAIREASGL